MSAPLRSTPMTQLTVLRKELKVPRRLPSFAVMPEISRFLGIIIRMYYRDHAPPHFHAEYDEYEITVEIATGVVTGHFPRRALKAVLEWYEINREALQRDWELAEQRKPLERIQPLE